jgi:hypothetical protein
MEKGTINQSGDSALLQDDWAFSNSLVNWGSNWLRDLEPLSRHGYHECSKQPKGHRIARYPHNHLNSKVKPLDDIKSHKPNSLLFTFSKTDVLSHDTEVFGLSNTSCISLPCQVAFQYPVSMIH